MIEPNGPLSASVYWRRRAIAAGVSLLAVVLLAWLIGGMVEAADQQPVQGTANSHEIVASGSPTSKGSTPTSAGRESAEASASAAPGEPVNKAGTSTKPEEPPGQAPSKSASAEPPAPPGPCPDAALSVIATPGEPTYRVGQRPLLRLAVTNKGPVPCIRDLGRQLREMVILSADGQQRLWSSNDCYGPPGAEVKTIQPNETLSFTLNWAGRTSEPGCPEKRVTVPAGTYQLVGKLGPLVGAPSPLVLV
jgi:hypothetical protein